MDDDLRSEPAPHDGARHRADHSLRAHETASVSAALGAEESSFLSTAPPAPWTPDDEAGAYAARDTSPVATMPQPVYGSAQGGHDSEPSHSDSTASRHYTAPRPGEAWTRPSIAHQPFAAQTPGMTAALPPVGPGSHTGHEQGGFAPHPQPGRPGNRRLVAGLV